jgi:hypothetical protein
MAPGPPALRPLVLRLGGGDVAVEAEDVVWVVAVFEGDEALEVLCLAGRPTRAVASNPE